MQTMQQFWHFSRTARIGKRSLIELDLPLLKMWFGIKALASQFVTSWEFLQFSQPQNNKRWSIEIANVFRNLGPEMCSFVLIDVYPCEFTFKFF